MAEDQKKSENKQTSSPFALDYCKQGNELFNSKKYADALAAYDAALAINPQYATAHYNRGLVLHDLGRQEEALVAFDAALVIDPQYANAHCNRGRVLRALGQRTNAINAYLAALAINENLLEAKVQLQQITGKSYESYKAEKMKELRIKLAAVAGEIGMFKRDEEVQGVVRMDSQAEKTQLPEDKKAQSTVKINSQAEETNLLKIILDYSICPSEKGESESSCCIS
jgi:tetratricopeptide (TPR) repeat protein